MERRSESCIGLLFSHGKSYGLIYRINMYTYRYVYIYIYIIIYVGIHMKNKACVIYPDITSAIRTQ